MAEYLKLAEVARRLDVSEKTARRYVKAGAIPSVFIGNAYRVSEADLEAYLQGARVQPEFSSPKGPVPRSMGELLEQVGSATRYHALPDDEFERLWEHRTTEARKVLNREIMQERRLIGPHLKRWREMTPSEERTRLIRLWEQDYFWRMLTAVERNEKAALVEADAARRRGEDARASGLMEEAEEQTREFAGAA